MKKQVSFILAALMAGVTVAGCGSSSTSSASTAASTAASTETASTEAASTEAASTEAASTETAAVDTSNAELTLNIASNQTSEENPFSYGLDKFKEVAESESGGKIAVNVYKGTLGENESELIEKLTMGAADLVVASPGFMTEIGVPEIDIFSLEYLFESTEHWETALDGEFGDKMKDIVLEQTGNQFKIMGYWSAAVRDVYAKKAITKPDDLKGLKIRTQSSKVQTDFFSACGAVPTSIAWGELYQALQQGVVDGAENDYTNILQKDHEKTDNGKYISETHHDYTTRLLLMNGDRYDALTDEQKQWIEDAAKAATATEREITYSMADESKQACIDAGAIITEHADIDIDAFKAIAEPIQDEFATEYGMEEELQMVRDAAE